MPACRRIIERLCQRAKIACSDEKRLRAVATGAHLDRRGDVCGRARRRCGAADVARHVSDYKEERRCDREGAEAESGWHDRKRAKAAGTRCRWQRPAIPIRGINSDFVRLAPGGAVPGDRIVGILTPGEASRFIRSTAVAEGL
jgi:(p)ppGpp synthase/HD superfamily hydrolase